MNEVEAIKSMRNLDDVISITESEHESVRLAISALEKQVPKKPKEYEDKYYACKCGNVLLLKWLKYPTELMPKSEGLSFCLCCGQKLDWSEEE